MKKETAEEKLFSKLADPDLVLEVLGGMAEQKPMPFSEFFIRYQRLHIAKYGKVLTTKIKK